MPVPPGKLRSGTAVTHGATRAFPANMSRLFYPLEVVGRGSETQLQVGKINVSCLVTLRLIIAYAYWASVTEIGPTFGQHWVNVFWVNS